MTSPVLDFGSLTGWRMLSSILLEADSEGRVVVRLPDDFLMLLTVRLEGWERPVREVLRPDHWLRRLQSRRWPGLRGTPARPLAFLIADGEGHPALELFSSTPDTAVKLEELIYLPVTSCVPAGNSI